MERLRIFIILALAFCVCDAKSATPEHPLRTAEAVMDFLKQTEPYNRDLQDPTATKSSLFGILHLIITDPGEHFISHISLDQTETKKFHLLTLIALEKAKPVIYPRTLKLRDQIFPERTLLSIAQGDYNFEILDLRLEAQEHDLLGKSLIGQYLRTHTEQDAIAAIQKIRSALNMNPIWDELNLKCENVFKRFDPIWE